MKDAVAHPVGDEAETDWRKNAHWVRKGFKDLAYLPAGRTGWNATLSALELVTGSARAGRGGLRVFRQGGPIEGGRSR